MLEEPEAITVLQKYSILNNLGSAYTFSSLDNESFLNIQYMQICMDAEGRAMKRQTDKNMFVAKDQKW